MLAKQNQFESLKNKVILAGKSLAYIANDPNILTPHRKNSHTYLGIFCTAYSRENILLC